MSNILLSVVISLCYLKLIHADLIAGLVKKDTVDLDGQSLSEIVSHRERSKKFRGYCRRDDYKNRISGGTFATKQDFKFMCSYAHHTKGHTCGITILTERYGLTSAYCCKKMSKPKTSRVCMRCGRLCQNDTSPFATTILATEMTQIRPEEYENRAAGHDICLVKFERRLNFNRYVNHVCLCKDKVAFQNKKGVVIGWGKTAKDKPQSSCLKQLQLQVLERDRCQRKLNEEERGLTVKEDMFCAQSKKNTKASACKRDEGSPFLLKKIGQKKQNPPVQIGIVSIRPNCKRANQVTVYTNIANYNKWIREEMGRDADDICWVTCGQSPGDEEEADKLPVIETVADDESEEFESEENDEFGDEYDDEQDYETNDYYG